MERGQFEEWTSREVGRLLNLVESERRYYQQMVSALPIPLVVLAEDRTIVSANRAFCKAFGLDNPQLSGRAIEQILPSERLIEGIRDAHVWRAATPNLLLRVDDRPLRVSIHPIRGREGESEIETLLIVEDLTTPRPADERHLSFTSEILDITHVQVSQDRNGAPHLSASMEASTKRISALTGRLRALTGAGPETPPFAHSLGKGASSEDEILETADEPVIHPVEIPPLIAPQAVAPSGPPRSHTPPIGDDRVVFSESTGFHQAKQPEERLLPAETTRMFQGMASHVVRDLNNLLMIISGHSEEIRIGLPKNDPMQADVDHILEATERICGLIGGLLEPTRSRGGFPKVVDVANLVTGMEEKIAEVVGKAVTVELHGENSAWTTAGPGQIEEVILAIASAIRRDMPTHSRLVITCTSELLLDHTQQVKLKPGIYTAVAIHRDGPALDQRARAAVFEAFREKESGQPVGGALARAYRTVRELSGDIALSGHRSSGPTFTIYLPHYERDLRTAGDPVGTGETSTAECFLARERKEAAKPF